MVGKNGNARGNTYIIAEIGQNHNGSIELAKKLIDMAAMPVYDWFSGNQVPGVSAVKFVKRDLSEELSAQAAAARYDSPHSFGRTYIEHRRALELSEEEHAELAEYARSQGLDFIETLCSPGCLRLLEHVHVDAIKIASRDVTNVPLLMALSERPERLILSSGMSGISELRDAMSILCTNRKAESVEILHCVSQYPAQYINMNLMSIPYLIEQFPGQRIGYSDHSIGIVMPAVAVAMGARTIEKHVTLSRNMKGSDQEGSLEPDGLWRCVRDIRNVEEALGRSQKVCEAATAAAQARLERSLAVAVPVAKGEGVDESDLCMLSPGDGLEWNDKDQILGKSAVRDIPAMSVLRLEDFG